MSEKEVLDAPMKRNLFFTEQVDQESISKLTQEIIKISEHDEELKKSYELHDITYEPKPIKIYIDSYGGYVYQCFGLLSVMDRCKTPIHTIVTGCAMSCGFMMLISGHKRFAHKYSTPLYHQVSSAAWGKLKDMEEDVEETKRLQAMLESITLKKTNISAKRLKEVYEKKFDWFMSADEALSLGVVDEILQD
jgi:ATP-dependent Clp protease protease subunit